MLMRVVYKYYEYIGVRDSWVVLSQIHLSEFFFYLLQGGVVLA